MIFIRLMNDISEVDDNGNDYDDSFWTSENRLLIDDDDDDDHVIDGD
jgi:hypothetical protein